MIEISQNSPILLFLVLFNSLWWDFLIFEVFWILWAFKFQILTKNVIFSQFSTQNTKNIRFEAKLAKSLPQKVEK